MLHIIRSSSSAGTGLSHVYTFVLTGVSVSDIWSLVALEMTAKYLPIAVEDPANEEARMNMLLAATYACALRALWDPENCQKIQK
jgi:alcohol dehydrogenase class IV